MKKIIINAIFVISLIFSLSNLVFAQEFDFKNKSLLIAKDQLFVDQEASSIQSSNTVFITDNTECAKSSSGVNHGKC